MKRLNFPGNKSFAFTIIDDTDEAILENIKPLYDILYENGLIITKTVWVYPPNDRISHGDCLQRIEYLDFIKDIKNKGFEIALHNVGGGDFKRNEIITGLNEFRHKLGFYPKIHVNHSYNKDNIYSGSKRFSFPLNYLVKIIYKDYDDVSGENPDSLYFWGDYHKKYIRFSRNYEIDNINTFRVIPQMPYRERDYDAYSNFWFGSTFASNPVMFERIMTEENIDRLEREGGVCILYTHLGYYKDRNKISGFVKAVEYIGRKNNGWFVPVSKILEFLLDRRSEQKQSEYLPRISKKILELHSLITRIKYRYVVKIDDYHFRKIKTYGG